MRPFSMLLIVRPERVGGVPQGMPSSTIARISSMCSVPQMDSSPGA